jgi:hypothetical protein
MRTLCAVVLTILFLPAIALPDDEISLFDSSGKPVAYIAEELTIYLWSGKPVAYLDEDSSNGGFHVYGFNGKHLGWFVRGVIRDHRGNGAGAIKEVFRSSTEYEPYKSYKQYKPYKSYKEYAPYRPYFSQSWSDIPLHLFLMRGGSD